MYKVVADSTVTLITLEEFKEFARVTASVAEDEALMDSLLLSALDFCEKYTGLSIALKGFKKVFTHKEDDYYNLTADTFELRKGIVTEITDIRENYQDGNSIVSDVTDIQIDNYKQSTEVYLPGAVFNYGTHPTRPFEVSFSAGWDEDTVPDNLKTAIMQLASYWYENRESVQILDENNVAQAPLSTTSILNLYKLRRM